MYSYEVSWIQNVGNPLGYILRHCLLNPCVWITPHHKPNINTTRLQCCRTPQLRFVSDHHLHLRHRLVPGNNAGAAAASESESINQSVIHVSDAAIWRTIYWFTWQRTLYGAIVPATTYGWQVWLLLLLNQKYVRYWNVFLYNQIFCAT